MLVPNPPLEGAINAEKDLLLKVVQREPHGLQLRDRHVPIYVTQQGSCPLSQPSWDRGEPLGGKPSNLPLLLAVDRVLCQPPQAEASQVINHLFSEGTPQGITHHFPG